jgi:hypothetical protein
MANNGTYGTKRPALIDKTDVDIFYSYRPNRNTDDPGFSSFIKLSSDIISSVDASDTNGNSLGVLPGIYNLRLPLTEFSDPGIYTIYIRPKEIDAAILDVSYLAAYPDVRGIVFNITAIQNSNDSVDGSIFNNGELVGYRIEYLDDSGTRNGLYRLITSSNRCEPVAQNLNDSVQNSIRYRFNDSSNLLFCTVTPSTAMSFKSSSTPYIGENGQKVKLVNTKFNPVMMEIELVEHDSETIATMLEGDQIRNLDAGLITTFNKDGEIYHQASYGHVVNKGTGLNADYKLNHTDDIYTTESDKMKEIKNNI